MRRSIKYELFQAAPTASNRHDEMLNILENMANLNLDYMVFGPSSLEQNTPGLVMVADAGVKILMVDYEPKEGFRLSVRARGPELVGLQPRPDGRGHRALDRRAHEVAGQG